MHGDWSLPSEIVENAENDDQRVPTQLKGAVKQRTVRRRAKGRMNGTQLKTEQCCRHCCLEVPTKMTNSYYASSTKTTAARLLTKERTRLDVMCLEQIITVDSNRRWPATTTSRSQQWNKANEKRNEVLDLRRAKNTSKCNCTQMAPPYCAILLLYLTVLRCFLTRNLPSWSVSVWASRSGDRSLIKRHSSTTSKETTTTRTVTCTDRIAYWVHSS